MSGEIRIHFLNHCSKYVCLVPTLSQALCQALYNDKENREIALDLRDH